MRCLSAARKGLSSWCNRKLATGLLLPILTYWSNFFVPNATVTNKVSTFWHKPLSWTTYYFNTTHFTIFDVTAALPPIKSLLKYRRGMAAPREVCSFPITSLASVQPREVVPSAIASKFQSHRQLLQRIRESRCSVRWSTKLTSTTRCLPLDSMYHLIIKLIRKLSSLPLTVSLQFEASVPEISCPQPKGYLRWLLFEDWIENNNPPSGYIYLPTMTPHTCKSSPRFTSGWIHQIRAGTAI